MKPFPSKFLVVAGAAALLIIIYGTLAPSDYVSVPKIFKPITQSIILSFKNLFPNLHISYHLIKDITINILLFIPFGFILTILIYPWFKKVNRTIAVSILASAVVSFLIETFQFSLPSRFPNAVDVLLNALSGGLGAFLAILCCYSSRRDR